MSHEPARQPERHRRARRRTALVAGVAAAALGVVGAPVVANGLTGGSADGVDREPGEMVEIEESTVVELEEPTDGRYEYLWDTPAYDSPDDWTLRNDPLADAGFGVVEPQVVIESEAYTVTVDSRLDDSAPNGMLCISIVLAPGGPTGPDGATAGSSEVCSPPGVYPQIAPFGMGGIEAGTRYVYGFARGDVTEVNVVAGGDSETVPTIIPDAFDGAISVFVAELSGDEPVQDIVPSGGGPSAADLGLAIPFESAS